MIVPIDSLDINGSAAAYAKGKRKASMIDLTEDGRAVKSRTLGGNLPVGPVVIREIAVDSMGGASTSRYWSEHPSNVLTQPPLLTYLCARIEGSDDNLEARNSADNGMSH
jgi:protein HIRA/HIR1